MNELKEIVDRLFNEYGYAPHYEVVSAEKLTLRDEPAQIGDEWRLIIRRVDHKSKAEQEAEK